MECIYNSQNETSFIIGKENNSKIYKLGSLHRIIIC